MKGGLNRKTTEQGQILEINSPLPCGGCEKPDGRAAGPPPAKAQGQREQQGRHDDGGQAARKGKPPRMQDIGNPGRGKKVASVSHKGKFREGLLTRESDMGALALAAQPSKSGPPVQHLGHPFPPKALGGHAKEEP